MPTSFSPDRRVTDHPVTPRFRPDPDRALLDGRDALVAHPYRYAIDTEPHAPYFALTGVRTPFAGSPAGSGRGYAATWELRDGRLYLVAISGTRAGGGVGTLADLFPEFGSRVFAHWFCGTIVASRPRPTIGRVVLDGIDAAGPATFTIDFERGIALDGGSGLAAATGASRPAEVVAVAEVGAEVGVGAEVAAEVVAS
jgi:hypothetical protein